MFGKFMNRYYYGKSGKGDFKESDLPKNRMQLLATTLRVRLAGLVRLNLMYVIVWIPALIVIIRAVSSWFSGLMALNEIVATTPNAIEEFRLFQQAIISSASLWLIPCLLITGPATAGISYVTRNWSRDEHAFVWGDFKDALKSNWKQALGISAINSVVPLLLYVSFTFYGQMASDNAAFMIPQILVLLVCLIWWLALTYFYFLLVTYDLKFKDILRNGFLLAIARFPQTLGIKIIGVLPLAITFAICVFFGVQYGFIFGILYYGLIGFTLSRFVKASYSNGVFDKLINTNIAGAKVNKGLRPDFYNEIDAEVEAEMNAKINEKEDKHEKNMLN